MEEDHPEKCKAEAHCELVHGEPEEGEEEDGLEDDAGEKPEKVDAGDEVEGKEEKIERRVESVDRDHHREAQLVRNQIVENRELLKSIEEQGNLNNIFLQILLI